MTSPAEPMSSSPGTCPRILLPIIIGALQVTLHSPKKQPVCKFVIDGSEAFSFPGTIIPEDKVKACHGLLARHNSQLQIQVCTDNKPYVQCDVSLWDLLVSEQEATLPMWKHESGKAKQKGDLRIQLKCFNDHLDLYQKGLHPQYPVFSNLVKIFDLLKGFGSVNSQGQKIARYCLATFYAFLKTDLARQREALIREKKPGDNTSVDPDDARRNALEDTVTQCRHQLEYLKRSLALYSSTSTMATELRSIGSQILDWVAEVSCVLCYHAHIYVHASYNTLCGVSSEDHGIILCAQEQLLYLRARMVYLRHENAGLPPKAMDELIEDLLGLAISETRDGDWKHLSYTAVLSCFCGPYADQAFEMINKKLQNSKPADVSQRDVLRRLLAHLLQGGDWIPHSIVFKAEEVTLAEKIGEGSYGSVRMGSLMVEGQRFLQPVAIKEIRHLLAGTPDDRKKQRRRLYLEIVNCWTLNHPKVLPLLGVDLHHGETGLVSPFKRHGDIINVLTELQRGSSVLRYRRPLADLSHQWIGEIICGMTYLHGEGIIHGDLRGNNIFVNDDLSIVIADFGLSIFANGKSKNYESRRAGSIEWLSPELLSSDQHTRPMKSSDIYSFAMVCIETYTGRSPFQGCRAGGDGDFQKDVCSGQRPPRPNEPSRHEEPNGALMNDDLWSLVQRCWNGDKALRPNASEVEQCLKELKYQRIFTRDTR